MSFLAPLLSDQNVGFFVVLWGFGLVFGWFFLLLFLFVYFLGFFTPSKPDSDVIFDLKGRKANSFWTPFTVFFSVTQICIGNSTAVPLLQVVTNNICNGNGRGK